MKLRNLGKWQVGQKENVSNFVEDDFYEFCRNSVWILFWENFYNYMLRNIFSEDWKLKIIALIYGRFDLRAFCVELTLRFWQTFRIYERKVHLDKVRKDKQNRYSKRICATRLKAKRQKTNYMTKHRTHNTRLCSQAGWRALSGFCARIHFVAVRQRIRPQTARAHSLGR